MACGYPSVPSAVQAFVAGQIGDVNGGFKDFGFVRAQVLQQSVDLRQYIGGLRFCIAFRIGGHLASQEDESIDFDCFRQTLIGDVCTGQAAQDTFI